MEQKKICTKCGVEKKLDAFVLGERYKYGHKSACKECDKEYRKLNKEKVKEHNKIYREENKEKANEYNKEYYENNKEKIKEYRENNKEKIKASYQIGFEKNKTKIRIRKNGYEKNKKSKDQIYKLSCNIRASIRQSIGSRGFRKKCKTVIILGCSFEEFKLYLESKFESWMSWDNYGKYNGQLNYGWDIDHIIPTSSAKTEEDIIKLNYYTNLQPLCSHTNRDIKRGN